MCSCFVALALVLFLTPGATSQDPTPSGWGVLLGRGSKWLKLPPKKKSGSQKIQKTTHIYPIYPKSSHFRPLPTDLIRKITNGLFTIYGQTWTHWTYQAKLDHADPPNKNNKNVTLPHLRRNITTQKIQRIHIFSIYFHHINHPMFIDFPYISIDSIHFSQPFLHRRCASGGSASWCAARPPDPKKPRELRELLPPSVHFRKMGWGLSCPKDGHYRWSL